MENFVSKQKLLELADKADISFHKVGLQSYKFHSFLSPEENNELNKIEKVCLDNGRVDSIGSLQEQLVIRNFMWDLDVEFAMGQYRINRSTNNDRKTHIIYGFGALEGNIPKSVNVVISDYRNSQKYEIKKDGYFHWFEPFIVVNRSDNVTFNFEPDNVQYKIYGMTCEALGANVNG